MKYLLEDVLRYLIKEALDIKEKAQDDFSKGILHGYYVTISHILNQLEACGVVDEISPELRNFDPDSVLIR